MPNSDKADKGGLIKSFNCDLQEKNHNGKKIHRGGGRGWEVQQNLPEKKLFILDSYGSVGI